MSCNRIIININTRRDRNNRSSSSRFTSSSDRFSRISTSSRNRSSSSSTSSRNRSSSSRCTDVDDFEDEDIEEGTSSETNNNFVEHLRNFIGRTVTIFTTSGGESGSGFTGVVLRVNNRFVTLLTQTGIVPGSSLGSEAETENKKDTIVNEKCTNHGVETDIPIDRIAAFVHNVA